MKKIFALFVLVIYAGIFLAGCSSRQDPDEMVTGVVRVFMHSPMQYSVMITNFQDDREVRLRTFDYCPVKFFADVPRDELMWVLVRKASNTSSYPYSLEFHIHSPKDVEGAGWNHGKGGQGQTIVIE